MRTRLLCLVVAALLAGDTASGAWGLAPSPSGVGEDSQQDSPFAGTWVANLAKSKRHPNHQFQSATLEFTVAGDTVTLAHGGVNAGGQHESGTVVLEADGQKHPVPEQPGVVVVTRWSGPRRLHTVAKSGGTTVGEGVYEVSADGKTLTATVSGTDASGAPFEQVIVFDRKQE
jgi:hypothetical protein